MEKNCPGYTPFMDYNMNEDPFINPMLQYDQAFSYYRYLSMQMDYKIKCKEYEILCKSSSNSPTSSNK